MDPLDPQAALLYRKAQLMAQEQQAMGGAPAQPGMPAQPAPPAVMGQAQFGGYGQPRPQPTPQQLQQLAILLQRRQ